MCCEIEVQYYLDLDWTTAVRGSTTGILTNCGNLSLKSYTTRAGTITHDVKLRELEGDGRKTFAPADLKLEQ